MVNPGRNSPVIPRFCPDASAFEGAERRALESRIAFRALPRRWRLPRFLPQAGGAARLPASFKRRAIWRQPGPAVGDVIGYEVDADSPLPFAADSERLDAPD